jgi:S1-C subfamily serine protease
MNPEMESSVTSCGNCHLPMPRELRFCRNCGFRLGEGSAEYTETVRFQDVPPGVLGKNSPGASGAPFGFAGGPIAISPAGPIKKRRGRISGMSWLFIGLLVFFIAAAAFTAIVRPIRRSPDINVQFGDGHARAPVSFVGVDNFDTADGGVTFDNVEPPGSPADKAGLVGGDIITSFDGQVVTTDDEMTDLLARTPIGKTVDVVFIRDGAAQTVKLTTISRDEGERLEELFDNRPAGIGVFGYEESDSKRVPIPDSNLSGVRLGDISSNLPADIAGVKEGDIVVSFDGTPIRTPGELLARVKRAQPYSTIKLGIIRGAEKLEIPVKMGKRG